MTKLLITISLNLIFSTFFFQKQVIASDCDCPKVSCNTSCEFQESVSFYTENCDAGKRTKSCARPACLPLDPLPEMCLQADNKAKVSVQKISEPKIMPPAPTQVEQTATVKHVSGEVWVERKSLNPMQSVERSRLRGDHLLFEGDTIETFERGKITLVWNNGNEVMLPPKSKLTIREYKHNSDSKNTLLDLIKGQVRSHLKKKLTNRTDSYEVRTPTAVAGVRGTDFVVAYNDTERLITSVQTLSGEVVLANREKGQQVVVQGGEAVSYIVNDHSTSVFSGEDVKSFVELGFMTPVYKISEKEIKQLRDSFGEVAMRMVATEEPNVCSLPSGRFNQCAWTCVNNPKGEKSCRTDLPSVKCERTRCNANGSWSDMNRLPASFAGECPPAGSRVEACDY